MIDGHQIIDFHGHVGRWDIFEMYYDADEIVRAMDAVGIDRSCVFNIFHPDGTTGNDQTAAFVAQYPDRFIGFAYVSPRMPERMDPRPQIGKIITANISNDEKRRVLGENARRQI